MSYFKTYLFQTTIKTLILQAMAEWYIRGDSDQTRLTRILEVAQDLKVSLYMTIEYS